MRPVVISLCDLTGNMVRPWAKVGYACYCYDVQHYIRKDMVESKPEWAGGSITYRYGDVRSLTLEGLREDGPIVAVFSFPPCTHLAISGARDWKRKGLRSFIDALELVEACRVLCENSGAMWMIENPVSRISTSWREPDHMFDPCDYGDPYTKRTCLWTGGGFIMPPKDRVEPTKKNAIRDVPPGPNRANIRSATPQGFARAVFESNAKWSASAGLSSI